MNWYNELSDEERAANRAHKRELYHANLDANREKARRKSRSLGARFSSGKTNAKERGVLWDLSKEQHGFILMQPCHYCGNALGAKCTNGSGLDRADNSNGYSVSNAVSCCKFCNMLKGDRLTEQEMHMVADVLVRARRQ